MGAVFAVVYRHTIVTSQSIIIRSVSWTWRPTQKRPQEKITVKVFVNFNVRFERLRNKFDRAHFAAPSRMNLAISKSPADIIYDGNYSKAMSKPDGTLQQQYQSCFTNNGDIKFFNLNAYKSSDIMNVINTYDTNIKAFDCSIAGVTGNKN